jgi:hypothetical protein
MSEYSRSERPVRILLQTTGRYLWRGQLQHGWSPLAHSGASDATKSLPCLEAWIDVTGELTTQLDEGFRTRRTVGGAPPER